MESKEISWGDGFEAKTFFLLAGSLQKMIPATMAGDLYLYIASMVRIEVSNLFEAFDLDTWPILKRLGAAPPQSHHQPINSWYRDLCE